MECFDIELPVIIYSHEEKTTNYVDFADIILLLEIYKNRKTDNSSDAYHEIFYLLQEILTISEGHDVIEMIIDGFDLEYNYSLKKSAFYLVVDE